MFCGPPHDGATFAAVTPHFFTVVLQNTLRDNRLLIPIKFVRKYGETLSNPVFVKLPCGSEWKMEVTKSNGRVCLQKGWPEFVKHYSIAFGHFLVFRYEGNSRFHAFIFDKSTVEIDYPLLRASSDAPDEEEIKDDESVEILEDFSPCPGKRKSSPSPCSEPSKKFRANPTGKSETEVKGTQSNEKIVGNSMRSGNLHHSKTMRGKFKVSAKESGRGDKSLENSTCEIVITPSHVGQHYDMCFPRRFTSEFFKDQSRDAILILSDGRTWPVNFRRRCYDGLRARFEKKGWEKFVLDNNLEAGDTCVFQLINGNKTSFKVTILKADSNSHPCHGDGQTNLLKLQRNVKAKTESACSSKHEGETKAHELVKFGHGQVTCIPKFSGYSRAIVAASRFSSKHPFFEKTVPSSYLNGQRLPVDFGRTYFVKTKTQTVTLQTGKNSWSVTVIHSAPDSYSFCAGWSTFARENSLRPGDICVYELIKEKDILLKVTIFKK